MLRKHQSDTIRVIDSIIAGDKTRNIVVKAVPGAGKSTLPIIAGRLVTAGLADAICWVCPRMSLQNQAERNFIDPFFREMFQHRLTIRSSTNENNPCRGLHGFVTTYQALGVDQNRTVLADFHRKRYVLVLDEVHHAAEDGCWTKSIRELYERAEYRLLMTGTMLRGDGNSIAFVNEDEAEYIEYGRRDALTEKAILPLNFTLIDGHSEWMDKGGRTEDAKISTQEAKKNTYALYTALRTEYARDMLTACLGDWTKWRLRAGHGKLLVVAANISSAKAYTEFLRSLGRRARIATSDDTRDAVAAIKDFKTDRLDILVSVGMAYEGLDVPAITHIACLTNIRSLAWIEQMVGRAVRVDPEAGPYEDQEAFIFAPKDRLFLEIKAQIEADQHWANFKPQREKKARNCFRENGQGELFETAPGGITPLSSKMFGQAPPMQAVQDLPLTVSEQEQDILSQIESHIRAYSFNNRYSPKRINAEVRAWAGRGRQELTLRELESCLKHVQITYPIDRKRGTGRRVPTRAIPVECEWRD